MLWAAMSLPCTTDGSPASTDALQGLATWALQFTPRVALADEAVVMEVEASVQLFGGRRALRDRVLAESKDLGATALAWAPTSLAALALARAGVENGFRRPLDAVLDVLPMETLSAVRPHRPTLARLGCKTLGDLRRLPRGGLGRRFDRQLLVALDQAYGARPELHAWMKLPEAFKARLELMSRVETAPPLLFGARRLLLQMCGWLAARHCGVVAFTLHWAHDFMRARHVADKGALTLRTAQPSRDIEHLCRLLAEHLAKVKLEAPVGELEMEAIEVRSLGIPSGSLLPDAAHACENLDRVLERLAARLGPQRVLRPVVAEDHRLEWMAHWQPAPGSKPRPGKPARCADMPQPTWILPEPLRLAVKGHRPMYQGVLQMLTGPHRVESGWWHRTVDEQGVQRAWNIQRDYWVAASEHAGVLWVYQERLAGDETAWYLHGVFA
ncbi:MAG: Y-family DNA polymerase [Gammaproteobacteria bacterium]